MHSFRILRSWALLSVALWLGWQDPQPASQDPQPKSSKEQDPKGQDSGAKKLIGAPKRNPLEGVYRLTERVVNGVTDKRDTRGYVAITGRYLFLNLATPGLTQEHPLVHAGVREWKKVAEGISTTVKLDYASGSNGGIVITPEGKQEARQVIVIRGGIRIMQSKQSWLEFERVE